jgi:hypothetical protein
VAVDTVCLFACLFYTIVRAAFASAADAKAMRAAEKIAKDTKLRMWKDYVAKTFVGEREFVGKVCGAPPKPPRSTPSTPAPVLPDPHGCASRGHARLGVVVVARLQLVHQNCLAAAVARISMSDFTVLCPVVL